MHDADRGTPPTQVATDPVYVGDVDRVEAEVTVPEGLPVSGFKLVVIDPGYATHPSTASVTTSSTASTALANPRTANPNTSLSTGRSATIRPASVVTPNGQTIHTREVWWEKGDPDMTWTPDRSGSWQGAVVHHTDGSNDYAQWEVPAIINGIYVYHNRTRHWGDIGYNFLVDKYGGIWEGRDEGVANQVVQASEVVGAHTKHFNSKTFGVAILGNFTSTSPSSAAVSSVASVIAWEFAALGISNPYGTFQYSGTQPVITGHGDASHSGWTGDDGSNKTTCPGQGVWNAMGTIRSDVAADLPLATGQVRGGVGAYWVAHGGVTGFLGNPTGDEIDGLKDGGASQTFQGGTVWWNAKTGNVTTVRGAILTEYATQKWEQGTLGYPTGDELTGWKNGGISQTFQNGQIHWTQTTGAHTTKGAIQAYWAAHNWQDGFLGYPTGDELTINGGASQTFQGGTVWWNAKTGNVTTER